MGIVETIIQLRTCGEVICAVEGRKSSGGALSPDELVRVGFAHGLKVETEYLRIVQRTQAIQIATRILAADLTGVLGSDIMPFAEAARLATEFTDLFPEPTLFGTNAEFRPSGKWLLEMPMWNPFTDAMFDTGVICVSGAMAGLLWVKDED